MTTFYIEKDGAIVLHDTNLKRLQDTLTFMPQFAGLDIQETDGFIVNGEIISAEAFAEMERQKEQRTLIERFRSAIQSWMDGEAMKLGYDSILSVCSYINTGNPKFDAEGEGFRQWRSAVWARGYELIDEVIAGQREVPDDPADVIALLPELVIVYPEEAGDAGNE